MKTPGTAGSCRLSSTYGFRVNISIGVGFSARLSYRCFCSGADGARCRPPCSFSEPAAAHLLNEGASRESHQLAGTEEEKPSTAPELIVQLDAAGIRRSVASI